MTGRPDHDLAARIGAATFSAVRLGEGYDMDQVDYELDLLQAAALRGEPLGPLLDALELGQVRLREGYDIAEVDAFLDSLRVTADAAGVSVAAGAPAVSEPVEDDLAATTGPVVPQPVPEPDPVSESAPVRRRGFLDWLFRRR